MPQRSKVALLPREVRKELDRQLINSAFSGYVELSQWLAREGYAIGKSALHVHGSRLERRIEMLRISTEQAQALVAAVPDDEGAVADASIRMAQERLFELLLATEEGDPKLIVAAGRALTEMARANTSIRAERRKARAEAAAAANKVMSKRGISAETAAAIRAAIAGPPG